jgi:hypothetical protein
MLGGRTAKSRRNPRRGELGWVEQPTPLLSIDADATFRQTDAKSTLVG